MGVDEYESHDVIYNTVTSYAFLCKQNWQAAPTSKASPKY